MPSCRRWARWRSVVNRGADELIESLTGLEVEVVAVCVAHERAKAFEQTGHPLADGVQQLTAPVNAATVSPGFHRKP